MSLEDELRKNMGTMSTDELLSIWRENRQDEWSPEAFRAVEHLLIEREITIPLQAEYHALEISQGSSSQGHAENSSMRIRIPRKLMGLLFVGASLVIYVLFFIGNMSKIEDSRKARERFVDVPRELQYDMGDAAKSGLNLIVAIPFLIGAYLIIRAKPE